jgi:hypothetical protein
MLRISPPWEGLSEPKQEFRQDEQDLHDMRMAQGTRQKVHGKIVSRRERKERREEWDRIRRRCTVQGARCTETKSDRIYGIMHCKFKAQNPQRSGGSQSQSGEELDRIYRIYVILRNKHPVNPACRAVALAKAG